MDKATAQRFIQTAHDRAWATLRTLYGRRVGEKPTIELNTRLRTTAARAWLSDNKIDVNYKLLCEFPEHIAKDTIPHECAHFVASRMWGEDDHGKPWKEIMVAMGLPADRCHTLVQQMGVRQRAKEAGIELPKTITLADGRVVDTMDAILKITGLA